MDMFTTKPIEELDSASFKKLIKGKKILLSLHALDYLSNKQRKLFKEEELIKSVKTDNPRKIYLQANGRYASYYRRKEGFRKIIIDVETKKIIIVTFMSIVKLPKVNI